MGTTTELKTIGRYEITGLLGVGGQGKVHSAVDSELGREVAIKSLHSSDSDRGNVDRFRSEAKSLARIIHSNITTLIDFFAVGDNLYMIMELVHGRTLDDIMNDRAKALQGKGLGVRESLAIVAQAADGLGYAHQMGVIHRDIKPSNLMITASGRVKLMDFGIARVRGSDRLTRAGSAVGTPLYMSPEQCMGMDGDERSDIYSLGIVLYEMLAGAPPFEGKTDHRLAEAHIKTPPPPLVPRIAGVTPQVENALMKALAKKPEHRYATMRAFSEALGAAALLSNATDIIKSHANLIEASTGTQEATGAKTFTTKVMAIAKSRWGRLVRQFNALHPAVKGMSAGLAGFAVIGYVLLWSAPKPADDGRNGQGLNQAAYRTDANSQNNQVQKKKDCMGTWVGCVTYEEQLAHQKTQQQQQQYQQPYQPPQVQPPIKQAETVEPPKPIEQPKVVEQPKPVEPPKQVAVAPPEPTIADLRAEFNNQNYGKAFELAKKLAKYDNNGDGGDREAQYILGRMFFAGTGGAEKNSTKAFMWFEKAGSQGLASAQQAAGVILWQNQDCRALPWFEKAAAQGNAAAQYSLGLAYEKGTCQRRPDREEAVRFYRLAAAQNHPAAMEALQQLGR